VPIEDELEPFYMVAGGNFSEYHLVYSKDTDNFAIG
jgi:hypothetical protein